MYTHTSSVSWVFFGPLFVPAMGVTGVKGMVAVSKKFINEPLPLPKKN